jgi:arylsulfatase A-like enzyme
VKVSQVRFSRREFLAGAATLAAVSALPAAALALEASRPKYVILVDWDGFDPAYLGRVPTPNLDALVSRGSLSFADGTFHTFSNPSRASMSTGAYPQVHGNAAYFFNEATNKAVGQNRSLAAETINEALASAGKTTASVQWYMVQNHGTVYGNPRHLYVQPGGPFANRVDVAIDILNRRPVNSGGQVVIVPQIPNFMAVYGSDLDDLGHREGAESPNIGPLLAELDWQLGRLIQATMKDVGVGIYEETAWILTSDHGMTTWSATLLAEVYAAITNVGYKPEFVTPGNSPRDTTEVIIVPNGVRLGDFTLRGRAATSKGRERVQAALEDLPQIARVFDKSDLGVLRVSDKLGDLVAEARVPWGFGFAEGGVDGAHGSLQEIKVPLLLAGAGIRAGIPPQSPGLVDIAPTIAALLATRPPAHAQGRALTESLSAL